MSALQRPPGLLPGLPVSVRLTLATDIDPTGMSPESIEGARQLRPGSRCDIIPPTCCPVTLSASWRSLRPYRATITPT